MSPVRLLTDQCSITTSDELSRLSPTSDFNFVKDTVRGFLALAECDKTIGKEIKIASNFIISMADTLNLIKEIMQSDVSFVTDAQRLRPKDSEVFTLWGDNSLITSLTDWRSEYTIEKGLEETVNWFLKGENFEKV